MKFGGSSVADPDKIKHVAQRLVEARARGVRVVATVSAMGDTTDGLLALARQVSEQPQPRELDMLLSTGERIACALVAMAVNDLGYEAVSFTGSQAGIITDPVHTKAKIREITPVRVLEALDRGRIVLVAGYQGFSRDTMDVTTLGRGGTDATAVALAAALGASCEIYSDVEGVFTADPRIVPDARKLDRISYEEMLEMSASGAKVLMLRAVEIARNQDVPHPCPVDVLERAGHLDPRGRGTGAGDRLGRDPLGGRGAVRPPRRPRPTRLGRRDLRGRRGRARERRHDPPERRPRVGRALLLRSAGRRAGNATSARARAGVDRPDRDRRGLRSRQGRAHRRGDAFAPRRRGADVPNARDEQINLRLITTSPIKVSCLIPRSDIEKAVRALHTAFSLDAQ